MPPTLAKPCGASSVPRRAVPPRGSARARPRARAMWRARPATRAAGDRRQRRPGPPAPRYAAREYAADRGGELGADSRVGLRVRVPPPERLGEQGALSQPGPSVLERRALCDQPAPGGEAAARHAHRSESEQLARLASRVGNGWARAKMARPSGTLGRPSGGTQACEEAAQLCDAPGAWSHQWPAITLQVGRGARAGATRTALTT